MEWMKFLLLQFAVLQRCVSEVYSAMTLRVIAFLLFSAMSVGVGMMGIVFYRYPFKEWVVMGSIATDIVVGVYLWWEMLAASKTLVHYSDILQRIRNYFIATQPSVRAIFSETRVKDAKKSFIPYEPSIIILEALVAFLAGWMTVRAVRLLTYASYTIMGWIFFSVVATVWGLMFLARRSKTKRW